MPKRSRVLPTSKCISPESIPLELWRENVSLQGALGSGDYRMMIVVGYKKGHLITREAIECRGKSPATEAAYLAALSCNGERALPVIVELAYQEYNQERDCFLGCPAVSRVLAYTEWDRDEWCSVERINSAIAERCAALQEAASTLARE